MSTTQFTELLTQAGRLRQKLGGACYYAESENVRACGELVSAIDQQVLAEEKGKRKIAFNTLYARFDIISNDATVSANVAHRKGDALAYMAAVSEGDARKKSSDLAVRAYMGASSLAITDLSIIHPDRLRLALNYSTFLHDIADETDQACYVAKRAMDNAQAEVDSLESDVHPESLRFIKLLRKRIVGCPDRFPSYA